MADLRSVAVLPRLHRTRRTCAGSALDPQAVINFAKHAICPSGAEVHCGLSLIPAGRAPETVAATDELPVRVDWLQHQLQQGPAVGAAAPGQVIASRDLAADRRWPDFGKLCVAAMNLRSMVGVPVRLSGPARGMLSFYTSEPTQLGHLPMTSAVMLARHAAPALNLLLNKFRAQLVAALDSDGSRTAIAVNILMSQTGLSAAQAFDLLCQVADDHGMTLLAVVLEVVRAGDIPDALAAGGLRGATPGVGPAATTGERARTANPLRRHGIVDGLSRPAPRQLRVGGPTMWQAPRWLPA